MYLLFNESRNINLILLLDNWEASTLGNMFKELTRSELFYHFEFFSFWELEKFLKCFNVFCLCCLCLSSFVFNH
jgi:hypothetical protein